MDVWSEISPHQWTTVFLMESYFWPLISTVKQIVLFFNYLSLVQSQFMYNLHIGYKCCLLGFCWFFCVVFLGVCVFIFI